MKFVRHTAGCSLSDHTRNKDVEELTVSSVQKKLAQCKQKWLKYVSRMEDIRYPKQVLRYRYIGRRPGRPLKITKRIQS
jgi:hypothetical protein